MPSFRRLAVSDIYSVTSCGEIHSCLKASGNVARAACRIERSNALGCVLAAGLVERLITSGRVEAAGGVAKKRTTTESRVVVAGCIVDERTLTGWLCTQGRLVVGGRQIIMASG